MYYYLIVNEGADSGLVNSQVLSPIRYNSLEAKVGIISIEKLFKSKKIDDWLKVRKFPIGVPYRLFLFNNLAFFLVPTLAFLYACFLSLVTKSSDSFIARSYFPGLVLSYLKLIKGNKYQFDPRSLFIHESTTKGVLKQDSSLFRQWLAWEKKIVNNSESVIVVASKQAEYYRGLGYRELNIKYIPCYSTGTVLLPSAREELLPFKDSDIVVCYYGSLDNGWNNIDVYSKIFESCIKMGYKICIISQNFHSIRKDSRFIKAEIFIPDTTLGVPYSRYLQACDYGVIFMEKSVDWETRLGVKFVEYLGNGLGVLVGKYVGEAMRISKNYFPAYSYTIESDYCIPTLNSVSISDKANIKSIADNLFSPSNFKLILNE